MRHIPVLFAFLAPLLLVAQAPPAELQALNDLYGGVVRFKIDKHDRLVADFFDGATHYRQDVAYLEHLDPGAIAFNAEEGAVMLTCTEGNGQCIDKELFKLNTIRHTGRSNLPPAPGDADGARSIAALRALIGSAQERLVNAGGTSGPKRP
ncbi:MAG: hypothetical protein JNL05_05500 [Flavobacteriales bacterium]|nr:hypothetical protein [Flavobacteriales bacterium]